MSVSSGTSACCTAADDDRGDEHDAGDEQQMGAGHAQGGIAGDGRGHAGGSESRQEAGQVAERAGRRGRCGRAARAERPAARAPAMSVSGSSPTWTAVGRLDPEALERDPERLRVGLRRADLGRGHDGGEAARRARSAPVPRAGRCPSWRSRPAAARPPASAASAGAASGYARNAMASVSDGRMSGPAMPSAERVGQQRGALQPQGGERRSVAGRGAVRAVVAHLDAHGALAARQVDDAAEAALERALQARSRRLDGDERPHRVQRDGTECASLLDDGGMQRVCERRAGARTPWCPRAPPRRRRRRRGLQRPSAASACRAVSAGGRA